jgi:hypothetical protein
MEFSQSAMKKQNTASKGAVWILYENHSTRTRTVKVKVSPAGRTEQ